MVLSVCVWRPLSNGINVAVGINSVVSVASVVVVSDTLVNRVLLPNIVVNFSVVLTAVVLFTVASTLVVNRNDLVVTSGTVVVFSIGKLVISVFPPDVVVFGAILSNGVVLMVKCSVVVLVATVSIAVVAVTFFGMVGPPGAVFLRGVKEERTSPVAVIVVTFALLLVVVITVVMSLGVTAGF